LLHNQLLPADAVRTTVLGFAPDLEPGLSPAEADLDTLLDIDGGASDRILAAAICEATSALPPGTPVQSAGAEVGQVRSCVRSPALGAIIALALLDARVALPGSELTAGGSRLLVAGKPLYRRMRR
jgi:glycine cleavage system aminomethyltransferase T